MSPDELRLECLRLAQGAASASGIHTDKNEVVDRARAYADFVAGEADAEIIDAARQFAKRVTTA
jgi:hypothetical protein